MPPSRWPRGEGGKGVAEFVGHGGEQPEVPPGGARDRKNAGDQDDGEQLGDAHRRNVGPREAGDNAVPPLLGHGQGWCS